MQPFVEKKPIKKAIGPLLAVFCLLGATAAVFMLFQSWRPAPAQLSARIPLDAISKMHAAEVLSRSPNALRLRVALRRMPYVVIDLKRKVRGAKVHLEIGKLEKIREICIYPKMEGQPYTKASAIVLPVGKAGGYRHHYNVLLPDGDYQNLRIDFRSGEHFGIVEIKGISLHPVETGDHAGWPYVLAFSLAVLILLPGILMFPLIHHQKHTARIFLALFPAYSVLFYVFVCLVWLSTMKTRPAMADVAALATVFVGTSLLGLLNLRRNPDWWCYLRSIRRELAVYITALMVCCFILVQGNNLPLENTWYTTICGQLQSKTYRAFKAHDPVFHYVNGIAISNDEPFSKYYAHHKLFYDVEDRGILPGTIYAALRSVLRNFSQLLADSYFIYTVIGSCFNLMVLFSVFALVKTYTQVKNLWLFSLFFSLNAFILVNYYLTWYKMAGAAFFLAGLYVMFQSAARTGAAGWGLAGMLLGIGANMHAGSALGIPLFFLWALVHHFRSRIGAMRALIGPALLVVVFAAANLPWSIIKKLYFHDQYRLLKEHFLAGYSHPDGMVKSVELFFQKVPVSEQVAVRIERLWSSLRLAEIRQLGHMWREGAIANFFQLWNRYEFTYTAFVVYPLIALALFAAGGRWISQKRAAVLASDREQHVPVPSIGMQMLLSVLTVFIIILVSYGSHPPDITYHQPMGVLVLLYLGLLAASMTAGIATRIALFAYMGLIVFRLVCFFG